MKTLSISDDQFDHLRSCLESEIENFVRDPQGYMGYSIENGVAFEKFCKEVFQESQHLLGLSKIFSIDFWVSVQGLPLRKSAKFKAWYDKGRQNSINFIKEA